MSPAANPGGSCHTSLVGSPESPGLRQSVCSRHGCRVRARPRCLPRPNRGDLADQPCFDIVVGQVFPESAKAAGDAIAKAKSQSFSTRMAVCYRISDRLERHGLKGCGPSHSMNRHTAVRPLQLMYPRCRSCKKATSIGFSKPRSTTSPLRRLLKPRPGCRNASTITSGSNEKNLRPVFSFKIRGAYNKIAQLSAISAQRGVICASAGITPKGSRWRPAPAGIPAVIVMPLTTPEIKVQAVAALGGEIILHGDDYDHAYDMRPNSAAREIWYSCTHSTIRMSLPARARLPWKSCGSAMAMKSMPFSCRSAAAG